jgi:hypothetical protein
MLQPIFIRSLKKSEYCNPTNKPGFYTIPDKVGYEKVYKPYGITGTRKDEGFYYMPMKGENHV